MKLISIKICIILNLKSIFLLILKYNFFYYNRYITNQTLITIFTINYVNIFNLTRKYILESWLSKYFFNVVVIWHLSNIISEIIYIIIFIFIMLSFNCVNNWVYRLSLILKFHLYWIFMISKYYFCIIIRMLHVCFIMWTLYIIIS